MSRCRGRRTSPPTWPESSPYQTTGRRSAPGRARSEAACRVPSAPATRRHRSAGRSSRNGLGPIVVDPARRHALEDAEAQEHLLEVGVARVERLLAPDGQLAPLDRRRGTPRAGARSTSGGRRGRNARRRRVPGTAGDASTPGCGGIRTRVAPSSRPRSGRSRRRAASSRRVGTCRPACRGRARARRRARPRGRAASRARS